MTVLQKKTIEEYKVLKEKSKGLHIFEISRDEYGKYSQTIEVLVDNKYISKHFSDNKLNYRKNTTFDYFVEQYLAEIGENDITMYEPTLKDKVNQLIADGEGLSKEKIRTRGRCSDTGFIKWLSKIQILNETELKKHPLYQNINTICFQKMSTGYDEMMGVLQALEDELSPKHAFAQVKDTKKGLTKTPNLNELFSKVVSDINYAYQGIYNEIAAYTSGGNITNYLTQLKNGLGQNDFGLVNKSITDIHNWYANEITDILSNDYCFNKKEHKYNLEDIRKFREILLLIEENGGLLMLNKKTYNKVFIVHGHDDSAKIETARFIEKLGFEAIILHECANKGQTIIEKIETNTDVDFGIILYTPCDVGGKDDASLSARARQNVVFEHGYLIAKLGRENVVALVKETVEFPSDISGVVYEKMDSNGAWKYAVVKELKSAGFNVDMNKI